MAICEICGCKTEELDFVEGNLRGNAKKMCSFCDKQLKALSEKPGEAQIRWLNAVVAKDVPERRNDTITSLNEILGSLSGQGISPQPINNEPVEKVYNAQPNAAQYISADIDKDQLILELLGRVEKLEKTLLLMKRKQIIKTIIEITVPIILGILILIVFFSSGLFDTLSGLYSSFV